MYGIKWGSVPFRLDNKWIKVDGFRRLMENIWHGAWVEGTASFRFASKLKAVKIIVKK